MATRSKRMDQLADVELQLCMHGLEIKELLRFARCSRRHFHLADSPFAWLHSSPLRVVVPTLPPQSRLLRHAPLAVVVQSADVAHEYWLEATNFERMFGGAAPGPGAAATRRIHSMDLGSRISFQLTATQWTRLLDLPCMHSLRVLRCSQIASEKNGERPIDSTLSLMRAILALPHLHTLQLYQCDLIPCDSALLALPPALTSLSLTDSRRAGDRANEQQLQEAIAPLKECAKLTQLSIERLEPESFCPLFTASNLRQLQSLTLERFNIHDLYGRVVVTPADFISVFSALIHLQSLELISCHSLPMLAHVHLAPALRSITLWPDLGFWPLALDSSGHDRYAGFMPSPQVVADLLTRCSKLATFAIVYHQHGEIKEHERSEGMRDGGVQRRWKWMVQSPELAPFGQRFQMRFSAGSFQLNSSKLSQLSLDSNNNSNRSRCCVQ